MRRSDISSLLDPIADGRSREAEKRRQVIGAMYRWGLAKGYVSIDPTAGTESYGRGDPRDRVLSPEEINVFWAWLDEGACSMPSDCIQVLRLQLCTGARIGEVAGIDASEVEDENGKLVWTLPPARSKNKSERSTPLVGMARDIIEQALKSPRRGPLFTTALSNRALTSTDVGHALDKRNLPVDNFSTHDLRRTVVSGMDELGIALDTIAAVVGHQRGSKDTRTLVRHYSRPRLDERIEMALTAWNARLRELIEGRARSASGNILRLQA
jgi:integrase